MVLEVNARPTTPQPDWKNSYPWILVGGQAMDRGFTVEGLTVTYMPRDMGVGNADTIEQRARSLDTSADIWALPRVPGDRRARCIPILRGARA